MAARYSLVIHLSFSSNSLERERARSRARAREHEQAKSTSSFLIMTTHKMEQKHGGRGASQASNSACAQSGMRHSRSPHEMRVRESCEARTRRKAQTLTAAGHLSHRHHFYSKNAKIVKIPGPASHDCSGGGEKESGKAVHHLHGDGEREGVGSGHSILDAADASWVLGARGWGKAGSLVEETRALQEQGWKRRSIRTGHYVYVSPDGKTFTSMADVRKYGKDDARKGDGEEAASAGGREKRRRREEAAVDSLKNYEVDDASPTVVNTGDSGRKPLRIKRMATVLQDVSEKEDAEYDDDAAGGGEAAAEGTVFRRTARRPQTHSETGAGGGGARQEQVCMQERESGVVRQGDWAMRCGRAACRADDNARTHSAYGDAQLAAAAAAECCATSSSCRCKADGSAAQTGKAADAEEVVGRSLQVYWSRYR